MSLLPLTTREAGQMEARQELAQRILALVAGSSSSGDALQQIITILEDYSIQRKPEDVPADLETHIQHFLSAKRVDGLSEKTLDNYRLYLGHFAKYANKDAADINTDDVRGYIGIQKVAESSLQTIINTLRSFFAWLTVEQVIIKNPMLKIKTRKLRQRRMRKSLSPEELERLRNVCLTIREKALVEFFYSTGCRISEVAGIRLCDVDFAQRSVRVLGKGGKERIVYFSIKAKLLLEEYLRERKGVMLFTNTRAPYTAMHTRSIQKIIRQLGEGAGLPERIHPHLLRHTFATIALNNGMDITIIQRLLGHAHLSTTEIYAQISQENVRQVYDRVVA